MADFIDDAQAVNELHQEVSLRNQQAKMLPETHPAFDGVHCVEEDCDVEIPPARLAMFKVRCVDCQSLLEKRQRLARHNIPLDTSAE
jgi:RNA polymerase-binding transcription factor DksA